VVNGLFGSITIAADGSYTYIVDNNNASVQALRTAGDTLTDVFTYTMSDSGGLTSTTQITITIQGANDAPVAITTASLSVAENGGNGVVVGTVVGWDVDADDVLTYSLEDDAEGRFSINPTTGEIIVANASLIDFEASSSHTIVVRVTDLEGAWYEEIKTISVLDINDAPVLDGSASFILNSITEDQIDHPGQSIASIIAAGGAGSIYDQDALAEEGIAITGLSSGNGTWQYSTDGGATWNNVGLVSNIDALLLRDTDWLRFVPNGLMGTTASFTFRAWDQTSGSAGAKVDTSNHGGSTAFSAAEAVAEILVSDVNDAPILDNSLPFSMVSITEDDQNNTGQSVLSILASNGSNPITDDDGPGSLQGIAVRTTDGSGTWQYSLNAGSTWQNVGNVGNGDALLLRDIDWIRFVPDGQNGTHASFTFRAWDQTSGTAGTRVDTSSTNNGGSTSLSQQIGFVNLTVADVNDAPVLNIANPVQLDAITEDAVTNAGQTVASIVGTRITDVDTGAVQGIAITGLDNGNSYWQMSIDGGLTWSNVGAVASDSALLLRDIDRIRFVPNGENGTSAGFTFRAWDQTGSTFGMEGTKVDASSVGDTTPFSTQSMTAAILVSFVNDAPTIDANLFSIGTTDEDTASAPVTVNTLLMSANYSDVDLGAAPGVAITEVTGRGVWQYSLDGNIWTDVGPVSATHALLLDGTDRIRYIPDGMNGEAVTISFRAWDQTTGVASLPASPSYGDPGIGGGTSAYSLASATAVLNVSDVNDQPRFLVGPGNSIVATLQEADVGLQTGGTLSVEDVDVPDQVIVYVDLATTSGTTHGLLSTTAELLGMFTVAPNIIVDGSTIATIHWSFDSGNEAFDYLGAGQTLMINYTIVATDSQGASDTIHVTVVIEGTNDAPISRDSMGVAIEAGGVNNSLAGAPAVGNLLENDSDIDNSDQLVVVGVGPGVLGVVAGQVGTSVRGLYGDILVQADGSYIYHVDNNHPAVEALASPNEVLLDVFSYTIRDTGGLESTAQVRITIQGANDLPIAVDRQFTVNSTGVIEVGSASGLLSGIADKEGSLLQAFLVQAPAIGALTVNPDGSYSYTSPAGSSGQVTFIYAVSDGQGSTQATVRLQLSGGATQTVSPGGSTPPAISNPAQTEQELSPYPGDLWSGAPGSDSLREQGTSSSGSYGEASDRHAGGTTYDRPSVHVEASSTAGTLSGATTTPDFLGTGDWIIGILGKSKIRGPWTHRPDLNSHYVIAGDYGMTTFELDMAALQQMLNRFSSDIEDRLGARDFAAGAVNAVFLGATAGVAVWCMGGSYLVSVVAASAPAWMRFDPIFIVQAAAHGRRKSEETSLADLTREQIL
jgi:VCBS repeat-containing protein